MSEQGRPPLTLQAVPPRLSTGFVSDHARSIVCQPAPDTGMSSVDSQQRDPAGSADGQSVLLPAIMIFWLPFVCEPSTLALIDTLAGVMPDANATRTCSLTAQAAVGK